MQRTKSQILADNRSAWNALMEILRSAPDGRMLEANAVGEWSLKDMLGHIATWDLEVAREVRQLAWGGPRIHRPQGFNDQEVAEQRALPLTQIQALLERAHREAMAYLSSLPEAVYQIEGVRERAHGCMAHHYAGHAEDVQRWVESRAGSAA